MESRGRLLDERQRAATRWSIGQNATVDVVVPVTDEERALAGCLHVLRHFLREQLPCAWTITVVDDASTAGVRRVASEFAGSDHRIRVLHLDRRGRGHALRTGWTYSDADVVVYLDVYRCTNMDALLPLIAPLINGHSDIALGSRLAPGARTGHSGRREVISRCYNRLIRVTHGARFSDAQCRFKAARTEVIRPLLADVRDDGFFDTELLLLAEHNGLRIHEVPVDWADNLDGRGRMWSTVVADVPGLARVARAKATGAARVRRQPQPSAPRPTHPDAVPAAQGRGLLWQLVTFGLIGVASTAVTAALYAVMRSWVPPLAANLAALVAVNVLNTEANRRLTFAGSGVAQHGMHLRGLAIFGLYYALTSGALLVLQAVVAHPSRWLEVAVLLAASVVGTAVRFVLFRRWVFPSTIPRPPRHVP